MFLNYRLFHCRTFFFQFPSAGAKTIEDFAFKPISRNTLTEEVNTPSSIRCTTVTPNREESSCTPLSSSSKKKNVKERSASNNKSSPGTWMLMHICEAALFSYLAVSDAFAELTNQRRTFNPPLMRNLSRGFEVDIAKDSAIIEKMERSMDEEDHCSNSTELTGANKNEVTEWSAWLRSSYFICSISKM